MSLFDASPDPPDRKPQKKAGKKPRQTAPKTPDAPPKRTAFDPSKMHAERAPADKPPAPEPLTVSQVSGRIDAALKQGLPARVLVRGEITNFTDRTHWYFALKDDSAVLSCVMFAGAVRKTGFTPENGMEVVATGSVGYFEKWGKTQLYCEALEPVGAGALELRFRKLVEEIRAKGWFDAARKRPIPRTPRRIAVVTSKTGAALQDVLDTLNRRAPFVEVLTVDVRVQGERAAPEIARALARLSRGAERLGIDTIILTRGGGSMEDLWAFNEPAVAEAIVRSAVPVVAAIGHETDTTIAELVADLRAATPTQAAVRAAPDADALAEMLGATARRLRAALDRRTDRERGRLERAGSALASATTAGLHRRSDALHRYAARLSRRHPSAVYAARRVTLDDLAQRLTRTLARATRSRDVAPLAEDLKRAANERVRAESSHVAELERLLQTTGPVATLRRGYSVTTTVEGEILRSAADAKAGAEILTRLADGSVRSTVSGGKKRRRLRRDDPGPSLFGPED